MAGLSDLSQEASDALRWLISTDRAPQALDPGAEDLVPTGLIQLQQLGLADKLPGGRWGMTVAGENVAIDLCRADPNLPSNWKPKRLW